MKFILTTEIEKITFGEFYFLRRNTDSHHVGDHNLVGLTVFLQLVGQGVGSSFGHKEFLLEVSEVLLAFFQLGLKLLVDFQEADFCPWIRLRAKRRCHGDQWQTR